jgi:uncharacterized protein (TIGR00661 family)
MKILFGVAGEGSGHASRAYVVAKYLESQGHKIKIITYHQGLKYLEQDFDVEEIFGLRFFHKDAKVDYPTTILENIKKTPEATKSLSRTKEIVKQFNPNIILTDFEPLSALCAHLCKLPLVSIDNQHILTHSKIDYDKKWMPDYFLTKTGVSTMAFKADAYILTSFFDLKITDNNVFTVPPILRQEILEQIPSEKNHILVYTTTPDINNIVDILFKKTSEKFIIYGTNKNKSLNNCTFKKFSKDGFLKDLATSKAIIGTAGLTLITEALYFHKPYLALPIERRFEQLLNSYNLKKLTYGNYTEKFTIKDLNSFLKNINVYKQKLLSYKKTDNSKLYHILDSLIEKLTK